MVASVQQTEPAKKKEQEIPLMKANGVDFHQVGRGELGNMEFPEPGGEEPQGKDLTVFKADELPADPLAKFRPDLVSAPPLNAGDYAHMFGGTKVRIGSQWHLRLKKK